MFCRCRAVLTIIDAGGVLEFQERSYVPENVAAKANARTSVKRSTGGVAALPRTAHRS
jgi:hypothetical protein